VVVQIGGINEFRCPRIETLQPGLARHRPINITAQAAVAVKGGKIRLQPGAIMDQTCGRRSSQPLK
jgi:hypothetical protein